MKPYWYCPNCKCEVDSANVTYEELHDKCGFHVTCNDELIFTNFPELNPLILKFQNGEIDIAGLVLAAWNEGYNAGKNDIIKDLT